MTTLAKVSDVVKTSFFRNPKDSKNANKDGRSHTKYVPPKRYSIAEIREAGYTIHEILSKGLEIDSRRISSYPQNVQYLKDIMKKVDESDNS